jgi:uncharacterized protein YoxC
MQISLNDLLLILIAVAVIVMAIYLTRLAMQARQVLERVEENLRHLEDARPKLDRILDGLDHELGQIRSVTAKVDGIAGDAEDVSGEMRNAVMPLLVQVSSLTNSLRHVNAAVTGARVGMRVLRRKSRRRR